MLESKAALGEEVVFYGFPCFREKAALDTWAKPTFKKANGKKGDLRTLYTDFGCF